MTEGAMMSMDLGRIKILCGTMMIRLGAMM